MNLNRTQHNTLNQLILGAYFGTDDEWRKDIELDHNDVKLLEIYFEHVFNCTKVHDKLTNEFHYSRRLPHHSTVKKKWKITFCDLHHKDRDHLVRA